MLVQENVQPWIPCRDSQMMTLSKRENVHVDILNDKKQVAVPRNSRWAANKMPYLEHC